MTQQSRTTLNLLSAVVGSLLASSAAIADTGFNSAGGAGTSVGASVNAQAVIPHVLLLRVGAAGTVSTLSFNPTITIPGGGGNWNGNALTASNSSDMVRAFAYTNNSGNAKLSCTTTGLGPVPPTAPIYSSDISVASAANAFGDTLSHPGTDLACLPGDAVTITRNTLYDAQWTYTLSGARVVDSIPGGTHTFSVGYTLTNL